MVLVGNHMKAYKFRCQDKENKKNRNTVPKMFCLLIW